MSENKYKEGDLVIHKANQKFDMVIVGNCAPENPTIRQKADNYKDPNRFSCRYYNPDTKEWEVKCFYGFELEPPVK